MVSTLAEGWLRLGGILELESPCFGIGRRALLTRLFAAYLCAAPALLPSIWFDLLGIGAALGVALWAILKRAHDLGYSGGRIAGWVLLSVPFPFLHVVGAIKLLLKEGGQCDCRENIARAEWRRNWLESKKAVDPALPRHEVQKEFAARPRMPL